MANMILAAYKKNAANNLYFVHRKALTPETLPWTLLYVCQTCRPIQYVNDELRRSSGRQSRPGLSL